MNASMYYLADFHTWSVIGLNPIAATKTLFRKVEGFFMLYISEISLMCYNGMGERQIRKKQYRGYMHE